MSILKNWILVMWVGLVVLEVISSRGGGKGLIKNEFKKFIFREKKLLFWEFLGGFFYFFYLLFYKWYIII